MTDAPIALITGGLHRVGACIAVRLGAAGYRLALHGRAAQDIDPAVAALIAGPEAAAVFCADLADPATPDRLIADVGGHFGSAPAVLVNNAAVFEQGDWTAADHAAIARHMQIDCIAPVMLARAAVAAGAEAIVNIVDQRVAHPVPDQFAYTLAKQALWQATRTMAVAFAPAARVNAVAPGPTLAGAEYDAAQWARTGAVLPLERHPDPDGVADAVLYLVRASAVTGQTIFVDAGAHLRGYARDFAFL